MDVHAEYLVDVLERHSARQGLSRLGEVLSAADLRHAVGDVEDVDHQAVGDGQRVLLVPPVGGVEGPDEPLPRPLRHRPLHHGVLRRAHHRGEQVPDVGADALRRRAADDDRGGR
jgi:hypothetical protein